MPVGLPDRDRVRVAEDRAGRDGEDRGSVGRTDVDAEMERAAVARIVERAADRVLLVERLDRPAVRVRERGQRKGCDACRDEGGDPVQRRATLASAA